MHDISEVTIGGRSIVEAMYANQPAWHQLGQIYDPQGQNAPDSEKAMSLAHLDWLVEKQQLALLNNPGAAIEDFWGLVRTDTGKTLSVVGSKYEVFQNYEGFAFLDSLLMDGIMQYETAFALQGGRQIVLLARMPSVDWVTKEDPQLRYVMCNLSHGGGSIILMPTTVRVICANTLQVALARDTYKVSIRHSGDMEEKLSQAKSYLAQFDEAFTGYIDQAQRLLTGYTDPQAVEYMGELFPVRTDTERMRKADEKKKDQVRRMWERPAQQMKSVKGTWWSLFNSVTDAVDHAKKPRESKNVVKRVENRFLSVSDGPEASFKNRAFNLALEMAS